MEEMCSSETLVPAYQTTRYHKPEESSSSRKPRTSYISVLKLVRILLFQNAQKVQIMLPCTSCGYETWSFALRKERNLQIFEKIILRLEIQDMSSKEQCGLYVSPLFLDSEICPTSHFLFWRIGLRFFAQTKTILTGSQYFSVHLGQSQNSTKSYAIFLPFMSFSVCYSPSIVSFDDI